MQVPDILAHVFPRPIRQACFALRSVLYISRRSEAYVYILPRFHYQRPNQCAPLIYVHSLKRSLGKFQVTKKRAWSSR